MFSDVMVLVHICNFIGIYFMLLLCCWYLPLNYIFTLLNPLVIRKIEGKIYPKISKWLSYVSNWNPTLSPMYSILSQLRILNILWMKIFYPIILVKIKFIFLPHGQGLNQHCLNCSDVRRCSWFSGELAHVECLESIVRSSDLSTCVPKSPWAM